MATAGVTCHLRRFGPLALPTTLTEADELSKEFLTPSPSVGLPVEVLRGPCPVRLEHIQGHYLYLYPNSTPASRNNVQRAYEFALSSVG